MVCKIKNPDKNIKTKEIWPFTLFIKSKGLSAASPLARLRSSSGVYSVYSFTPLDALFEGRGLPASYHCIAIKFQVRRFPDQFSEK
jgi:hypothetical protein